MANKIEDERFAHIAKDPRFKKLPKKERKLKIDKRFKSMFNDDSFKLKYSVDKRGRPIQLTSRENLKKYYELSDSEESENFSHSDKELEDQKAVFNKEDSLNKNKLSVKCIQGKFGTSSVKEEKTKVTVEGNTKLDSVIDNDDSSYLSSGDENVSGSPYCDIRGEGIATSSSDDDNSSDEEDIDEEFDHGWGELDADAERGDDISHRFAVCNMDWDRIKAIDLLLLFNSFKPPEGTINNVKIYVSNYGRERLKEEELKGPVGLSENEDNQTDDDEAKDGRDYHMEKLRKYQLNRLKYYYAVVDCDSSETANKIYSECNGVEYEASSAKIDLRFIPDDVTFEEEPTSIADRLPEAGRYAPSQFMTKALQQAKVELTWDETNPDRTKTIQKAFDNDEIAVSDIKAYLASSSDEDSDDAENKVTTDTVELDSKNNERASISKYKALLLDIEKKEKGKKDSDIEMEVSWDPGLVAPIQKEIVNKFKAKSLTPWEKYLEKKKEKQAAKTKEKTSTQGDTVPEDQMLEDQPFSDDDIPSDIDLNDPYFKEELEKSGNHHMKKKKEPKSTTSDNSANLEARVSKEELELLMMDESGEAKHFSMKSIIENENKSKSKRKRKAKQNVADEDRFQVNVSDTRFEALYTSHDYNIDPSSQNFKRTKAMEDLIHEKQRRHRDTKFPSALEPPRSDNLSMLIKSVKNKTNVFIKKKRRK